MDWGLAKVLARAGSPTRRRRRPSDAARSGIVRTANPTGGRSQARAGAGHAGVHAAGAGSGRAAAIDARTDVFGLGAILCDILTGQPPYSRRLGRRGLPPGRPGDLDDARARLDACGADAGIARWRKRCLAAERGRRPADAGVVAAAVAAYLASTQDRLRQAQVGPGRRRKQHGSRAPRPAARRLGLAAALLIGVGVAGWQAVVAYRAARRRGRGDRGDGRERDGPEQGSRDAGRAQLFGTARGEDPDGRDRRPASPTRAPKFPSLPGPGRQRLRLFAEPITGRAHPVARRIVARRSGTAVAPI